MLSLEIRTILRENVIKIANATQKVKCNARVISVANSNERSLLYQIWTSPSKRNPIHSDGVFFFGYGSMLRICHLCVMRPTSVARWGSEPTAAGGGNREASEWPRSADEEAAPSATKMPGTATG